MKTTRVLYAHTRHRRAAEFFTRARASAPHTRATRAGGVDPSAPRSHAPERAGGDARRGDGAYARDDDGETAGGVRDAEARARRVRDDRARGKREKRPERARSIRRGARDDDGARARERRRGRDATRERRRARERAGTRERARRRAGDEGRERESDGDGGARGGGRREG